MLTVHNRFADNVRRAPALEHWKDVISEDLLDLQIQITRRSDFSAAISKFALGPLKGNFIAVDEPCTWHMRASAGRARDANLHLIQIRRCAQRIEQRDKSLTVDPGGSLLVDCSAGYELRFPDAVDALVIEIPRSWVRGWLPVPELAVGRVFESGPTWAGTLNSALSNLTAKSLGEIALSGSVLAEQLAVLLALATQATAAPTVNSHRRSLLRRLADVLRERCHEPELDPAAVAASLGISRRYVHALFASGGTTFSQELYSFRLQRAQRLLKDQRFDGVSIGEIAWNCGFNETSHFRRRFREKFGVSPTEFRQAPAR